MNLIDAGVLAAARHRPDLRRARRLPRAGARPRRRRRRVRRWRCCLRRCSATSWRSSSSRCGRSSTMVGLGAFVIVGEAARCRGRDDDEPRPLEERPAAARRGGRRGGRRGTRRSSWSGSSAACSRPGMAPSLAPRPRDSVALRIAGERLPRADDRGRPAASHCSTRPVCHRCSRGFEPAPAPPVDLPRRCRGPRAGRVRDRQHRAHREHGLRRRARRSAAASSSRRPTWSPTRTSSRAATTTTVTIGGAVHRRRSWSPSIPTPTSPCSSVPDARAPALQLSETAPTRGTTGVALGYPGGGELTVTPAGVTAALRVGRPEHLRRGLNERSVVEMTAQIRRGNSGGPLVIAPGVVGGVVFGASRAATRRRLRDRFRPGARAASARPSARRRPSTPAPACRLPPCPGHDPPRSPSSAHTRCASRTPSTPSPRPSAAPGAAWRSVARSSASIRSA